MKKHYLALLAFALPLLTIAQPTINNAENYSVGEEIHYQLTTATAPGPGGHQTWDFSSLPDTGAGTVDIVQTDSNGGVIVGGIDFMMTSTTSYMISNGLANYTPGALYAKRPIAYNDVANNSFVDTTLVGHGSGTCDLVVDGWGTLKTPAATYTENVLRVRLAMHQVDSGIINLTTDHVYYLWYVDNHHAPVFRVDSITTAFGSQSTTQFLTADFPTAVPSVNYAARNTTVNMSGNKVTLNAALELDKSYEMSIFNISGQKVYQNSFTATTSTQTFNLNQDLPAGTYILSFVKKNSINAPIVLKTIKQ
ncbi:MAG: T9SS type A sorting domain-containing protein [Bacteroidetes bacterium]|nr:T9SS type A sorting domain-containing protein [Bacteroidota bacterium]